MMKRRNIWNGSNKMQAAVWHLASLMLLFIAVASCNREPLELYKKGDSKVTIGYDWNYFNGPKPNGIYVMYFKDGNTLTQSYPTHDLSGETNEQMPNGYYKQMVMTNTIQDYEGNIRFYDVADFEKIRVQSEYYNITSQEAWDKGMRYMEEPMKLGVAVDSFEVKMDNDGLVFYEYDKDDGVDTLNQERQDTIRSMTTTLTIRVKVRGINYIKDPSMGGVDGYITGLANGCSLSKTWRSTEVGNIKLNHWRLDGYETPANSRRANESGEMQIGWVAIDVETFGLPHGRELLYQRTDKSNFIKLHFVALDGTNTKEYSYDVGKMISYDGDDGTMGATFDQADVSLHLDLLIDAPYVEEEDVPTMPYSQPEGTGQFDADVQPWGDDENVDVPM